MAYDAEKPIAKLRTPHYTERVELKEPLEFPCKSEYERSNVSIEGLKVKDRLEGNPEILPPPPPDDDDDEGGDDDDGHGGGGEPSSKVHGNRPRESWKLRDILMQCRRDWDHQVSISQHIQIFMFQMEDQNTTHWEGWGWNRVPE